MNKEINETIAVLDFGGQYNQLITRRIRDLGVYSELYPNTVTAEELKQLDLKGIIFSGGPNSAYVEGAPSCDPEIYELGVPILGICYGMQLMTHDFGGKVEAANHREYGKATMTVQNRDVKIHKGLPEEQLVWMSHGDKIVAPPEGFTVDATSPSCPVAAMSNVDKNLYGVQYHPEVRHTEHGNALLKNFVYEVCNASGEWSMENFIDMEVEKIKQAVGDKKVLCALSGGLILPLLRCSFTVP